MATILTNSAVIAGEGTSRAAVAYRALVAAHGHDALCDAYGLDRDGVDGGTWWQDVVSQALAHGDIDSQGNLN